MQAPPENSVKATLHAIADQLPKTATYDDAMYEVYVQMKIERGLAAIAEGRVVDHAEAKRRLLGR